MRTLDDRLSRRPSSRVDVLRGFTPVGRIPVDPCDDRCRTTGGRHYPWWTITDPNVLGSAEAHYRRYERLEIDEGLAV